MYRISIKLLFITLICWVFNFQIEINAKQKINSNDTDSAKFWTIVKNFKTALSQNPDSALLILQNSKVLINKEQNRKLWANYKLLLGDFYRTKNQVTLALPIYKEAYSIFSSLGDKLNCFSINSKIGICYMIMSQYNSANENFIKALKYYESVSDSDRISGIYLNLSFISNDLNETDEMEKKLLMGLSFAKSDIIKGKLYNNLGINYKIRGLHAKSIKCFELARAYDEKAGNCLDASITYHNTGTVYYDMHLKDSAMYYYKKCISYEKICPDNYLLSQVYRDMATIEKENGNMTNALFYINKSITYANDNSMAKVISEDYDWLAEFYSSLHNFEKAYVYKTKSAFINDSILTETKIRQTKEIEAIYQTEKKQSEINLLSEQNKVSKLKLRSSRNLVIFMSFSLLLIIGLSILIIRQNKLKADNKSLELEHKLLRSQMNPHFIFNALAAIQNQVLQKPAIEAASYLSGFAKLMRSILYSSRNETIPLSQEIETLEEYLKLQKLRLKDKLNYEFKFQLNDDVSEIAIPPMLLQPFIENSIEHGIAKKDIQEGNVWIYFVENKNNLIVTIEDDGVGLKDTPENKNGHISLATRITEERIKHLSKSFKTKFHFSVENRIFNNNEIAGAKVLLQLPLLFVSK